MRKIAALLPALLVTSLPCGGAPVSMPPPTATAGKPHSVIAMTRKDTDRANTVVSISANNSVVYEQHFSGQEGAPVLGVGLHGERSPKLDTMGRTMRESAALFDRVPFEPQPIIAQALAANGIHVELLETTEVEARGGIKIYSLDGTSVAFYVMLLVEYPQPTAMRPGKRRTAEYYYQLPSTCPRARLLRGLNTYELAALQREAAFGLSQLVRLYATDARGQLQNQNLLKFHSRHVHPNPRAVFFGYRLPDDPGRFTVRMNHWVMSLLPETTYEVR